MVFWSGQVPCATCGEAVDSAGADAHACDADRRVEFQMVALRHQIQSFDRDLQAFLAGNEGRFETWLAARQVRRDAGPD